MTTAQVVETPVTVNNNSPIQDYVHPDDQTQPTFEMCIICNISSRFFKSLYRESSLVPRRSLLTRCPREVWERAGERTPSQYWQNTPDFSAILPLVTFYNIYGILQGKWKKSAPFLRKLFRCWQQGHEMIETLEKKTAYKFTSAIHIVLALDDIKSQKSKSDFSTVFGLLLLSHGAGKALLDVLEPFGLCKGYEF